MRKFPGVFEIDVLAKELADHVTVAPVGEPFSSTRAIPLPVAPLAAFQLDLGTNPATSEAAMVATEAPTRSMLMAPGVMTTKLVVAEWVRLPLVPVMVTVEVAVGVVPSVVTVSVEVPLPLMVAGEKLAVAPAGKPLALRVTVPANPFRAPTVTE